MELENDFFSSAGSVPVDHTVLVFLATAAQWPTSIWAVFLLFSLHLCTCWQHHCSSQFILFTISGLLLFLFWSVSALNGSQIRQRGFLLHLLPFPLKGLNCFCVSRSEFFKNPQHLLGPLLSMETSHGIHPNWALSEQEFSFLKWSPSNKRNTVSHFFSKTDGFICDFSMY